jgi:hypothetical protein
MMHPPTALPRSLAENVNPPPVDPVVRGEQPAAHNEPTEVGSPAWSPSFAGGLATASRRTGAPALGLVRRVQCATDYPRSGGSSVPASPLEMRRQT